MCDCCYKDWQTFKSIFHKIDSYLKKNRRRFLAAVFIGLLTLLLSRLALGSSFGKEIFQYIEIASCKTSHQSDDIRIQCNLNQISTTTVVAIDKPREKYWRKLINAIEDPTFNICGASKNYSDKIKIELWYDEKEAKGKTAKTILINSAFNCTELSNADLENLVEVTFKGVIIEGEYFDASKIINDLLSKTQQNKFTLEMFLFRKYHSDFIVFVYFLSFILSLSICSALIQVGEWCEKSENAKPTS